MADVALVPQRLVFQGRGRVATEHAGQARHALREDRVALVGHRGRALLALLERLHDLADLRVLEVANFGREALQAPAEDRDRREQRRVAVALDDLRARLVDTQLQLVHDLGLDLRLEVAVRPDGTAELAGRDLANRLGEAPAPTVHLERPAGELQPERGRLGVHRVGPAHHHGAGLCAGSIDEDFDEAGRVAQQQLARRAQLERERSIDHVGRGKAQVQVAAFRPDGLCHLRDERDHVVVGRSFELLDPVDVDCRPRLDGREGALRDPPAPRLRPAHGELDPEHVLEPCFVRPERAHLRQRVAPDHEATPAGTAALGGSAAAMSRRRCMPSHEIRSAARSAAARAATRSAPRPTTVSTRPPFVP